MYRFSCIMTIDQIFSYTFKKKFFEEIGNKLIFNLFYIYNILFRFHAKNLPGYISQHTHAVTPFMTVLAIDIPGLNFFAMYKARPSKEISCCNLTDMVLG